MPPVARTPSVERSTVGSEEAQNERGRSLPTVRRVARVIPGESVPNARHLEQNGSKQQHSDEQVQPDQLVQIDDRHPEHGELHEQDHAGDGRQLLVSVGPAPAEAADEGWSRGARGRPARSLARPGDDLLACSYAHARCNGAVPPEACPPKSFLILATGGAFARAASRRVRESGGLGGAAVAER